MRTKTLKTQNTVPSPAASEGSIRVQRFGQLGEVHGSWLHARHHFSFGRYYNPERMGFGTLRVINDDRVKAGQGFEMHPHQNMEIITYVRSGAIHHRDNLGNEGVTNAGDVQVMSAGTGVFHSEHSGEGDDVTLYQIWIEPNEMGVKPRWKAAEFPKSFVQESLPVLVSGRPEHAGKNALFIHADAAIFGGRLEAGKSVRQAVSDKAYLLVSEGEVELNGTPLQKGDGAEIEHHTEVTLHATTDTELVLIDHGTVIS